MHNAISPLPKKDIDKLHLLIQALKRIDNKESSQETTKILNKVEKYLNQWLKSPDTDALEPLQQEQITWLPQFPNPLDVPHKAFNVIKQGLDIKEDINSLRPNRRKEMIVLGYYLQGKLEDYPEEIKYIKKVLRSYLATIEQFRSSPNSQ